MNLRLTVFAPMLFCFVIAMLFVGEKEPHLGSCAYTWMGRDSTEHDVSLSWNDYGGCGGQSIQYSYVFHKVETWRGHSSTYTTTGKMCAFSPGNLRSLIDPDSEKAIKSNNLSCER